MFKLYVFTLSAGFYSALYFPYLQIILRNMGFSQSIIGIILGCGQLCGCIFPLFICNIADKNRKTKQLFIICMTIMLFSLSVMVKFPKLYLVLPIFMLTYTCSGSVSSFSESVLNQLALKNGSTFPKIRSFETLFYVVTLVFVSIVGYPQIGNNNQIVKAFLTADLIFIICTIINPSTDDYTVPIQQNEKFFDSSWFSKGFYLLVLVIFIKTISSAVIDKFLGSYVNEVLNQGDKYTLFVALGAFSEFFALNIYGKLLKKGKINEWSLIVVSCLGIIIRLGLYALSENIIVFCVAQLFHGFMYAAAHVAAISYITKYVPNNHAGLATAIYSSISLNFSEFLGSIGSGFIIDYLGYRSLFIIFEIFPLIALVLCYVFKNELAQKKARI